MSLNVYLEDPTATYECDSLYDSNITHNLSKMAVECNLYEVLWDPIENGYTVAEEIIDILELGLNDLKKKPNYYEQFNSPNGWGLYKHFVPFVEKYLDACKEYPKAKIVISK